MPIIQQEINGIKYFQYDIWSDTVYTTSRKENMGSAGKVNISLDTYNLIKDNPSSSFEPRGKVKVKYKGEIHMYFLEMKVSDITSYRNKLVSN